VTETGWGGDGADSTYGSGGRVSAYEAVPSYQTNLQYYTWGDKLVTVPGRAVPDISMCANSLGQVYAVSVYNSHINSDSNAWEANGGTSLSAPLFAGMVAVINQGRVINGLSVLNTAELHAALYSFPGGDLYDVTEGYNGYPAGPGYDLVTGLGAPNGTSFMMDLASWVAYRPAAEGAAVTVPRSRPIPKKACEEGAVSFPHVRTPCRLPPPHKPPPPHRARASPQDASSSYWFVGLHNRQDRPA
jgi:hypothetical protein